MRLSIRAEQMEEIEKKTQDRFVRRIALHLRENYADAEVILADEEKYTVSTLPKGTLTELVKTGIARARTFQMTFESSIAAFTALMFEISPNFYTNSMCQVILTDEGVEPNKRIDPLLEVLSEKSIKTMKSKYDPKAWKLDKDEIEKAEQPPENPIPPTNAETPDNIDFLATIKVN